MLPNNQFPSDQPLGQGQLNKVWDLVSGDLRAALGDATFDLWFGQSGLVNVDENHAVISSPGSMWAIWIEENFRDVLKEQLDKYLIDLKGFSLDYSQSKDEQASTESAFPEFENQDPAPPIESSRRRKRKVEKRPLSEEEILEKGKKCGLNEAYTFESFVVGPNSQLAAAASHAAVESPGTKYQPLFFHSQSGMGKTHLLHAIGWAFLRLRPHSKVLYVGAEKFANEYIDGIRNSGEVAFRTKFREVDLLLIDDVQFLGGKSGFQREFFHTFNSIIDQRNQIVIASDCLASEISHLEERLVSRLQWGMTVQVEVPDGATSEAILRKKRDDMNLEVTDDIITKIVRRVCRNVRQLEGALIRTAMVASLNEGVLTEDQLDDLLADMVGDNTKMLGLEEIKRTVGEYFGVDVTEMESKRRTNKITEARQVAMYLSRELTTHSLKEVAGSFAKDHASVVYAVKATKEKSSKSESLRNAIELLRRRMARDGGVRDRQNSISRSRHSLTNGVSDSGSRIDIENSDAERDF